MKNWPFIFGSLIVVAIMAFLYWPDLRERLTVPEPVPVQEPASRPEQPTIQHPIEQIASARDTEDPNLGLGQPLPALAESDTRLRNLLTSLFVEQNLDRFFSLEHIVERFVVMVDNLPRAQLSARHRILKKIRGDFLVRSDQGNLLISEANYKRYEPLVDLLHKVDQKHVISVYLRFYPLFQEAYEGLGYPSGYFNDRLIEVIDHLLQAPIITGPIYLEKPKFYYQFADPSLESLSAGHKIMLRIGPDNAKRIKALLRAYRTKLAGTTFIKH